MRQPAHKKGEALRLPLFQSSVSNKMPKVLGPQ